MCTQFLSLPVALGLLIPGICGTFFVPCPSTQAPNSTGHVTHLLETFQRVQLEGFASFPAKKSLKLTLYLLVVY